MPQHSAKLSCIFRSAVEYCASAGCYSATICFRKKSIKDAMLLITRCLRTTPTENLYLLASIQPSKFQTKKVTPLEHVSDVWGTLLEHGLRFTQGRHTHNSVKEQDPICAWTNGIAQHQSAGG